MMDYLDDLMHYAALCPICADDITAVLTGAVLAFGFIIVGGITVLAYDHFAGLWTHYRTIRRK